MSDAQETLVLQQKPVILLSEKKKEKNSQMVHIVKRASNKILTTKITAELWQQGVDKTIDYWLKMTARLERVNGTSESVETWKHF